jgi:hypothetical protein
LLVLLWKTSLLVRRASWSSAPVWFCESGGLES